jgi:hypothetical protein
MRHSLMTSHRWWRQTRKAPQRARKSHRKQPLSPRWDEGQTLWRKAQPMTTGAPSRNGYQDDPPDLPLLLAALTRLLEDVTVVWEERKGQLAEADALRAVALLHALWRFREGRAADDS